MKKHATAIVTVIFTIFVVTFSHLFLAPNDSNKIIWGIHQVNSQSNSSISVYSSFLNIDVRPIWIKILECVWAVVTGYAIICWSHHYSKLRLLAITTSVILTTIMIATIFWIGFNALIDLGWIALVVVIILSKRLYNYFVIAIKKKKTNRNKWQGFISDESLAMLNQTAKVYDSALPRVRVVALVCKMYNIQQIFNDLKNEPNTIASIFKNYKQEIYNIALKNKGTIVPSSTNDIAIIWNYPIYESNAHNLAGKTAVEIIEMCQQNPIIKCHLGISEGITIIYDCDGVNLTNYAGDVFNHASVLADTAQKYHIDTCVDKSIKDSADKSFVCVKIMNEVFALLFQYRMDQPAHITIAYNQHDKLLAAYQEGRNKMAIIIAKSLKTAWNGSLKNYYESLIIDCQNREEQLK